MANAKDLKPGTLVVFARDTTRMVRNRKDEVDAPAQSLRVSRGTIGMVVNALTFEEEPKIRSVVFVHGHRVAELATNLEVLCALPTS